jgi:hypothetical protein
MSTDNSSIQPKITAEQALQRVLELIRTSKTIADFTSERVQQVMGVPLKSWEGGFGFDEPVTPAWHHGFSMEKIFDSSTGTRRPRFEFAFSPNPPDSEPSMRDICPVDVDHFEAALQAMGFTGQSVYDSPPQPLPGQERLLHGRRMYDSFDRPGLRVQVYPQWEHALTPETGMGRMCVKQVYIY